MTSLARRLTLRAALVLALAGLLLVRPARNDYAHALRQAHDYAAQLQRTAAAATYREAARLRPPCPAPYLSLARLYLDWGRTDAALEAVAAAEARHADPVEIHRLRAVTHVARARAATDRRPALWAAARARAHELLQLRPRDPEALSLLARAHLALRDWEAATEAYTGLLALDPAHREAQQQLGILLLGPEAAALDLLRASDTPLAHELLHALAPWESVLSAPTASPPGEIEEVDRALALASARAGQVLLDHGEWALAARQLELAVRRSPAYAEARAYLGYALDHMDYPSDARRHLSAASTAGPESPVVLTLLGAHYDRSGDAAAARAQYETAYDLAPDSPAICLRIGQTWAAEGRYVAAEIWLQEAVSLRPDDPELWAILARFYLDHGIASDGRAVATAERLLTLDPGTARSHHLRGWAALQTGDYPAAEHHLQRAIRLDPHLARAHYHLGQLWTRTGHPDRARDAFTSALDLDTTGELLALVPPAPVPDPQP